MAFQNRSTDSSGKRSTPAKPGPPPIINEEADRELGKIMVRYGIITIAVWLFMTVIMAFVNLQGTSLYRLHRPLDLVSAIAILAPFFIGMKRLFDARLRIGRQLAAEKKWRQVVAALEPFAAVTQRFLDGSGEAHYLLLQAHEALSDRQKADKARKFLTQHRPGSWADKLKGGPSPRISESKAGQEKKPSPANIKRRKRF